MRQQPYQSAGGDWIYFDGVEKRRFSTELEAQEEYQMDELLLQIIADMCRIAREQFAEYGNIIVLDSQFTDHQAQFTQAWIDSQPILAASGITVQELADVMYAIKMAKNQIDTVNRDAFIEVMKLPL